MTITAPRVDPKLTPETQPWARALDVALDRLEKSRREPIAVVGMGCRFPGGAEDPDLYWQMLCAGHDGWGEVPSDRWDAAAWLDPSGERPGSITSAHGHFLSDVAGFEPEAFGIAPAQAVHIDPQQRLLLEVCHEALAHAGLGRASARARTGVFMGIGQNDYARRRLFGPSRSEIDAHDGPGNGLCFAAGRIAHVFGLEGPSLAIDTACSSSLQAVHLACQSLRAGECDFALAGGVHLVLEPHVSTFLSRSGALSPDGRCKTFSARADGYGRGEGCGVVVLARRSSALERGDQIWAWIRGSAINHDGHAPGLTVPNASAQARVLRDAYRHAGVDPMAVDYVETHGTGTALGDPIEIRSLAEVLVGDRSEALRLGAVKANLGHLEAAAGIAGLIKTVLALHHRHLPPQPEFAPANPRVDWQKLGVSVAHRGQPWPNSGLGTAGVSAFGMSGSNAHVVLTGAQPREESHSEPARELILLVSARDDRALAIACRRYAERLAAGVDAASLCRCVANGQFEWARRIFVRAETAAALERELWRCADGLDLAVQGAALGPRFALDVPGSMVPDSLRRSCATHPEFAGAWQALCTRAGIEAASMGPALRALLDGHALASVLQRCGVELEPASLGPTRAAELDELDRAAVARLRAHGLIELGPGEARAGEGIVLAMKQTTLGALLAQAWCHGAEVDWDAYYGQAVGHRVALPAYPFQRRRFYFESPSEATSEATVLDDQFAAGDESGLHAQLMTDGLPPELVEPAREVLARLVAAREKQHRRHAVRRHLYRSELCALRSEEQLARVEWAIITDAPERWRDLQTQVEQLRSVEACVQFDTLSWSAAGNLSASPGRGANKLLLHWTTPAVSTADIVDRCLAILELHKRSKNSQAGPRFHLCVDVDARPVAPGDAAVMAFVSSLTLDQPELWGPSFVVDGENDLACWRRALAVAAAEEQVLLRHGRRFVPRVVPMQRPETPAPVLDPNARYLVTGASGAVGRMAIRWLAEAGAGEVVGVARRVDRPQCSELVAELSRLGCRLSWRSADVSQADELTVILGEPGPWRGIVHCAGAGGRASLSALDKPAMAAVMAAKVEGARHLDRLTRAMDLQLFLCVSSIASVWGSASQAHYAAAQRFVDGLCAQRVAEGRPATSIQLGPLAGGGLADASALEQLAAMGIQPWQPEQLAEIFDIAARSSRDALIVADIDWPCFRAVYESRRGPGLLERRPAVQSRQEAEGWLARELEGLGPSDRVARIRSFLQTQIQQVIGAEQAPSSEVGLFDLGVDSLSAVGLARRIAAALGRRLPSTLLFDAANIDELVDLLAGPMPRVAAKPAALDDARAGETDHGPSAVAGMDRAQLESELERLCADFLD